MHNSELVGFSVLSDLINPCTLYAVQSSHSCVAAKTSCETGPFQHGSQNPINALSAPVNTMIQQASPLLQCLVCLVGQVLLTYAHVTVHKLLYVLKEEDFHGALSNFHHPSDITAQANLGSCICGAAALMIAHEDLQAKETTEERAKHIGAWIPKARCQGSHKLHTAGSKV